MKKIKVITLVLVLAAVIIITFNAEPLWAKEEDRTLSPYFFVMGDDPELDRLPLRSTSVIADIAGVIADVKVTQVYENTGKSPIEAIYVFPASTKAAVYSMRMTIGERIINAEVKTKEQARKDYEEAKGQGKSASLLEQHRPNVFQMNVANIMPGDVIKVELSYTELIVPEDKVYEFVYPTVVGPRYSSDKAGDVPDSEKWVGNPYLMQGEDPTYAFDMHVNLAAGMPVRDISSSSHNVDINYDGTDKASASLSKSDRNRGNKDFILKYRLAGKQIHSGLMLYEGKDENFFLLMMQPPERIKISQIPPREYIFIVDVSGSMHGFPLDISKKLLKDLIGNLRPEDRFNVLLFAGGSSVMSQTSLPATPQNIRNAINVIERQRGGGGTELLPALKRALSLPGIEDVSRTVVIVTDGYVTVEKEAFDLIRNNLSDANMFSFGIGSSVNRYIIDGMARVGMGEPFIITKPEEAKATAEKFRKLIETPVLTSISIDYEGFKVYDVEPVSIPDVMAERPVIVFGKWRGKPRGTIILRGLKGDGNYAETIDVDEAIPSIKNSALRYLWARHRIAVLDDYNRVHADKDRIDEVTDLGLTYNLLTQYTSFVAIDNIVRNKDGKLVTVKQPLPLPEGVSNQAVGGYAPASASMKRNLLSSLETKDEVAELEAAPEETLTGRAVNKGIAGEGIQVEGGMTPVSVENTISANMSSLNNCYKQLLKKHPGRKGIMDLELEIEPHGKVKSVKVIKSSFSNRNFIRCILKKIRKITFGPSSDGNKVTIRVTLKFQ
ncbi:MAG: AgmX/PglI C-terminal domain-containing protein [Nitrospirota bacterium]|nr:MAG: AgmX/PglI C-terminal domain-containing protein [Nitrospirota bacterium]